MIYFDYTATTKPSKEVLNLYEKICNDYWYNPSSLHKGGTIASEIFGDCEKAIIEVLRLKNKKVIFTSGATESNNIAIYGICNNYLGQNKHIITTCIEHPAVLSCFKDLENKGFRVTYLNVDENGLIKLDELADALDNDTILVSIMWVNNIVGSIQPIEEVLKLIKKYPRIKMHIDAAQGMGKVLPEFDLNEIDLISFSSHKINGLKSSGALIINDKINLNSPLKGATQQFGIRPGTIDLALSSCTVKSLKMAVLLLEDHFKEVSKLHQYFLNHLKNIPNIIINGSQKSYSPYILNISILNSESETFIRYLEQKDIYVAAGSACNSKNKAPEKTILAMYHDERRALTSIRISLSFSTTTLEIDEFIKQLQKFVEK